MRKTYIDNIRWITVVLVVLYHVIFMFNAQCTSTVIGPLSEKQPQDAYQYVVYPWFMLLLFVVSGMSAKFEFGIRTEKEFLRNRTRKLLVPSTIGLLVFGWATGYFNMAIAGPFTEMASTPAPIVYLIMCLSGTGVLWYIQLLWVLSLLLLLVRKIEKDRLSKVCSKTNLIVSILFVVPIFGAAQILNTPMILVYRFGIYGLGFFLGYFVFSHDEVMERLGRFWYVSSILALISGVAFVIIYFGQPYAEHVVLDTPLCNAFAWFGTLGVLSFMKKWGNFSNGFSKWMSKKSWGLYVFHYMPLAAVAYCMTKSSMDFHPAVIYLAVCVSAFAGAFVIYEILSRIPFVRWCVLGMKKKGKEK